MIPKEGVALTAPPMWSVAGATQTKHRRCGLWQEPHDGWQDFSGEVDWQTDVVGHIGDYSGTVRHPIGRIACSCVLQLALLDERSAAYS